MTFEEWAKDKDFTTYIEECEYGVLMKMCFEAGYEAGRKDKINENELAERVNKLEQLISDIWKLLKTSVFASPEYSESKAAYISEE